ncbi:hypothetical protein LUZ60_016202 [Juncus effusus]|nr:hypothetical protein LUZ60_016202 [Juncus effusus]
MTTLHLHPHFSPSLIIAFFLLFLRSSSALGRFYSGSFSFTFLDAPARFAVPLDRTWICGSLHVADPIQACSELRKPSNGSVVSSASKLRFVLIVRGTCSFEEKVRNAQNSGFQAALIYNDREMTSLYSMVGDATDINIHAVFISRTAGETLKRFSKEDSECCINSAYDETSGTVLVISFVSLLVILSVFGTFLFVRNCHLLRRGAQNNRPMSVKRQSVEMLPCFVYKFNEGNDKACSICLEEYRDGETVRILPCKHEFHAECVDPWLTKWGTFCPVCKHEVAQVE